MCLYSQQYGFILHQKQTDAAFQSLPGNKAFLETFQFCWSASYVFVSILTCRGVNFLPQNTEHLGEKKKVFQVENWKQDILVFSEACILFISKLNL